MTHRRRVLLISAAALAVGFAFAAQSTDHREETNRMAARERPWVPGTSTPMSAYESRMGTLAPPQ